MAKASLCSPNRCWSLVLISAALLVSQQLVGALTPRSTFVSDRRGPGTLSAVRLTELQLQAFKGRNGTDTGGSTTAHSSFWAPSEEQSSRLQVRNRVRSAFRRISRLQAVRSDTERTTWSRPADEATNTGVRNRVQAVLQKAKQRTGVSNNSEDDNASLWIAETASIGGLPDDKELVIKKNKNGVAKVNGVNSYQKTNGVKANGATGAPLNGANETTRNRVASKTPSRVEDIVVEGKNSTDGGRSELDGLRTDVLTPPPEPLPFTLPTLSAEQKKMLLAGERVQEQSKMGREGSGYVVMDVKAPPFIIWECLLDFENYPQLIKTVRSMEMFTSNKLKSGYHAEKPVPPSESKALRHYGIPSVTRAAFVLSKFKLNIGAIHNYRPHPDGHYMIFSLDPDCTNMVLKSATGIWHVQNNPDGRGEEYSRVWLLCELSVSRLLPQFIVDYTAKRAMPRATNWLKPYVEPLAEQWIREHNGKKM